MSARHRHDARRLRGRPWTAIARPEGRDAAARLARARLPGLHVAEPHARPAARVPLLQPAGAGVGASSRSARRTRTAQAANSVGFARYDVDRREPADAAERSRRALALNFTDVRCKATSPTTPAQLQVDHDAADHRQAGTGPSADASRRRSATGLPGDGAVHGDGARRIGSTCSLATSFNAVDARRGRRRSKRVDLAARRRAGLRRRLRRPRLDHAEHAVRDPGRLRPVGQPAAAIAWRAGARPAARIERRDRRRGRHARAPREAQRALDRPAGRAGRRVRAARAPTSRSAASC